MITKPASSLPSLRQPHGDHRDVRGGSRTSPSPLRAGAPHRDEYVMMPLPSPSSPPLPLASPGHDGARPLPRFRIRSGTQSPNHLLSRRPQGGDAALSRPSS